MGDGSGLINLNSAAFNPDNITSGTTKVTANTTGYVSFTSAGTTTGYYSPGGVFSAVGISTTAGISATQGYFSNNVGIGMAPANGQSLSVNGNITIGADLYMTNGRGIYCIPTMSGARQRPSSLT